MLCMLPDTDLTVIRVHEEFFLPGEVIMEQGNVVDQLYFVCHGMLEEIGIGADGSEETVLPLHLTAPLEKFQFFATFLNHIQFDASYHGDLYQLKSLIRAGADPNKTDYDGRSPLEYFVLLHFLKQVLPVLIR
ncbi:Potassium channel SKOR [Vitis vinifera]|uniref:Potassium channel SKOR n=1 Tax=Vitis vinifera TaxID=29760 RepID=A0A438GTD3_VITVI|nr:Potassium channel SKOR [Vitis vinifera]